MGKRPEVQESLNVHLDGPGRMTGALTVTGLWMKEVKFNVNIKTLVGFFFFNVFYLQV